MGIQHDYTCRNCRQSCYSDNSGKCYNCGKDFGTYNIESQCYFWFSICLILAIILIVKDVL